MNRIFMAATSLTLLLVSASFASDIQEEFSANKAGQIQTQQSINNTDNGQINDLFLLDAGSHFANSITMDSDLISIKFNLKGTIGN